jgi:TolB-like protein/Flp pilus assembly protein TadD
MGVGAAVIRTPDQRLRVFVSSTILELANERSAAVKAIRDLKLTPVLFELGARPHPSRTLYRAYLEQSHVFVGVYGESYGWIAPGMEISGLEDEYLLAEKHPKLIYVKDPVANRDDKLKDLLRRIEQHDRASYKIFSSADELQTLLANDLAVLLSERFETSRDPPNSSAGAGLRASRLRFGRATAAAGIAAAMAVAASVLWLSQRAPSPGRDAAPPGSGAPVAEATSIAVLPFVNMSPDPDQEYFSDGLSEELLNVLARLPALRVISRTSSFQFKGEAEDVRDIAHKLNVAHVLEGSVRKSGQQIRITAQLVNGSDGSHEWSQTYDRNLGDVFRVQDEIAAEVAGVLEIMLAGSTLPSRAQPRSTEAYNLVLEARYFSDRRTQESLAMAIEHLERALALDPDYATAWAELARAYLTQSRSGFARPDESVEHARRAAEKALALDPNQAMAHAMLGRIWAGHDWDWEAGDRAAQRALALDPGNARILSNAGIAAMAIGRLDESISLQRRSIARDPLQDSSYANLAIPLLYAGQLGEADTVTRQAIELRPEAPLYRHLLAKVLLLQGKIEQASEQNALEPDEGWRLAGEALIHHAAGHGAESEAALAALTSKFPADMPFQIAEIEAYRGEIDSAFAWLERARVQHDSGLGELKNDPFLRKLEADPRYARFLHKVRLP